MEFSVLMSVYKRDDAKFLLRAIESVTIEQILKPNQLVLVQDGEVSEAITKVFSEVEQKLSSENIEFTLVQKEQNAGLAAALNTGLKHCKYEYVARMDADDVSLPDRFKVQFEYLLAHPEISVVGGAISEFLEDENLPVQSRIVPKEHKDIVEMLKTRNAMNHVSVVFKKEDVLKVGGYCENFGQLEDYKLWVDFITAGLILNNVENVLVLVRIGSGFINRRSNKREIKDWDNLQQYLVKNKLIGKFKAFKNKVYIRIFIYMPKWMKKLAYKTVLRKKNNEKV